MADKKMDNLASGSLLGHYRIIAKIGAGGMGEVFLAEDIRLNRKVALKVLPERVSSDKDRLRRFEQEAYTASALNHPNILTIYEFGMENGVHFLATEFVKGETLREKLNREGAILNEVIDIAQQTAFALSAAHEAGIVHRDIKPENIMVRRDGIVKVLDFGLAKLIETSKATIDAEAETRAQVRTEPGVVLGTMAYMSPEQARGKETDSRTDIWSLGCVMYEMIANRAAFDGETTADRIAAIIHKEPLPLSRFTENVPIRLEEIISKCLEKKADERYQTAKDLLIDLRRLRKKMDFEAEMERSVAANSFGKTGDQPANQTTSPLPVRPETHYVQSGDANIAYQVVGSGNLDVVFVMGWVTHLEYFWKEPHFAAFLTRLASFSRLILFDKRGTGLSDRVPINQLPTLEQRMEDVHAVMNAVGSERAALIGVSEGGPMCSLFAATYPEKTTALVMIGTYANGIEDEDYPWTSTAEQQVGFSELIRRDWGKPIGIEERAPTLAHDEDFRNWWATYLRMGASPGAAVALNKMNAEIDVRNVLPTIRVPTLVIHRTGDTCLRVEEGRFVASQIPGCKFVEFKGIDHVPFVGNQDEILDEIEVFLTGVQHLEEYDRVLATVMNIKIVPSYLHGKEIEDWQDLLERSRTYARRQIELFKGREISYEETGILAAFDGPARAIRCALTITESANRLGVKVKTGLHTGECDVQGDKLSGVAVNLAQKIAEEADLAMVLVSRTVKDLVAGSGISFADLGVRSFPEIQGEWRLFRVETHVLNLK